MGHYPERASDCSCDSPHGSESRMCDFCRKERIKRLESQPNKKPNRKKARKEGVEKQMKKMLFDFLVPTILVGETCVARISTIRACNWT